MAVLLLVLNAGPGDAIAKNSSMGKPIDLASAQMAFSQLWNCKGSKRGSTFVDSSRMDQVFRCTRPTFHRKVSDSMVRRYSEILFFKPSKIRLVNCSGKELSMIKNYERESFDAAYCLESDLIKKDRLGIVYFQTEDGSAKIRKLKL